MGRMVKGKRENEREDDGGEWEEGKMGRKVRGTKGKRKK